MSEKESKPEPIVEPPKEAPKEPEKPIFTLKPVTEKPKRKYRKGSKYDPILDAFLKSPDKLVKISVEGKDANYLRTQLGKRVDARKDTEGITISVLNNVCYLEKK